MGHFLTWQNCPKVCPIWSVCTSYMIIYFVSVTRKTMAKQLRKGKQSKTINTIIKFIDCLEI